MHEIVGLSPASQHGGKSEFRAWRVLALLHHLRLLCRQEGHILCLPNSQLVLIEPLIQQRGMRLAFRLK